jgi:hypothetical protein
MFSMHYISSAVLLGLAVVSLDIFWGGGLVIRGAFDPGSLVEWTGGEQRAGESGP